MAMVLLVLCTMARLVGLHAREKFQATTRFVQCRANRCNASFRERRLFVAATMAGGKKPAELSPHFIARQHFHGFRTIKFFAAAFTHMCRFLVGSVMRLLLDLVHGAPRENGASGNARWRCKGFSKRRARISPSSPALFKPFAAPFFRGFGGKREMPAALFPIFDNSLMAAPKLRFSLHHLKASDTCRRSALSSAGLAKNLQMRNG